MTKLTREVLKTELQDFAHLVSQRLTNDIGAAIRIEVAKELQQFLEVSGALLQSSNPSRVHDASPVGHMSSAPQDIMAIAHHRPGNLQRRHLSRALRMQYEVDRSQTNRDKPHTWTRRKMRTFHSGFAFRESSAMSNGNVSNITSLTNYPRGSHRSTIPITPASNDMEALPSRLHSHPYLNDRLAEIEATSLMEEEEVVNTTYANFPADSMHELVLGWVESSWFRLVIAILITLNSILIGVETEYRAATNNLRDTRFFKVSETFFCMGFTIEICLRIFAYRGQFFQSDGWCWNVFDTVVVGLQLVEQVLPIFIHDGLFLDLSIFRILSILQQVRITRLIRVLRLIEDLRTIVSSIISSMKFFAWTMLLLFMMVYLFSVLFMEAYLNVDIETATHADDLKYWYGCLSRTALTLFEAIAGGVSWDEAVKPVISDVSPFMGVVFCCYILGVVFAMMNVVTGVFVEQAIRTAQQDKDQYMTSHISDLFFTPDHNRVITWEEFRKKMNCNEMQEYFKSINVDPNEARGLFDLLDVDGNGEVDAHELINGCLRLRGGAKALELSLLMQETLRMFSKMSRHHTNVERDLAYICCKLGLADELVSV